jgi:hypothetical protein
VPCKKGADFRLAAPHLQKRHLPRLGTGYHTNFVQHGTLKKKTNTRKQAQIKHSEKNIDEGYWHAEQERKR